MASGPLWGLPAGQGALEDIWRAWGNRCPPPPHPLGACPALPCWGILPAPSVRLLAQPVWAACEPCWCPAAEAWWRAKAGPGPGPAPGAWTCRESAAALKAWLGRHRQNPYPTKGEKVLLALLSRMSLTQVSTWFANARRRLKKERRAHPRRQQEDEEEEEEEEQEPARKQAKIWSLAELAARPPDAPAAAAGIQQ